MKGQTESFLANIYLFYIRAYNNKSIKNYDRSNFSNLLITENESFC